MNDWWDYVQRITGSATQQAIADKTGIGQSSIARWREKSPRPDSAATFARAYGRPPIEAFKYAGFLSEEEAKITQAPVNLAEIDTDDLIAEVRRRIPD
ncbi:helix-turn-helix domain-containing protein [Streptosporangium vulgare]|uniref:Helix-turn-helix domain-containing protein n=1 Tax=Streptosporangium vulgare TaxID=46190 RepID=A0ABV5TS94_9ACTN